MVSLGFSGLLFGLALIGQAQAQITARQIFQFSTAKDIENVAVRSNGQLVLNLVSEPSTYILDPCATPPTAKLVTTYPGANSALGIAEYAPDVFAVVAGNYTPGTINAVPGSFAIWSLNLTSTTPVVKKIVSIPGASALNGMTIGLSSNILLVADSVLGAVWSVNIASATSFLAIQNSNFNPTSTFPLGINGVHVRGPALYFTNSAQGLFGLITINANGTAAGSVQIVANGPAGDAYDDFFINSSGNAFIATHPNLLIEVAAGGQQTTVVEAGNSPQLVQPSSVVLARGGTCVPLCTSFVVTGGSVNSTTSIGGQVFQVSNAC